MSPSTRDLLASVLGELPLQTPSADPSAGQRLPEHPSRPKVPGPWRVTAKISGGGVQISNNVESRVVPKEQVELYLRGHGPRRPLA